MRNIILTGASGFLGYHLIQKLRMSYRLRCLVRSNSKRYDHPNIEYYEIDFLNPVFNKNMFDNIFAVIHLLSIKSSYHPDIFRINIDFTKKLVKAALLHKVKKFVYISSETVQLPGEDSYTKSKKRAEEEVIIHNNHLILRPTVIYGKGNKSDIGLLIELVKRLPVVPVIGNGKQLIQPISVEDVIKCINSALLYDISGIHLIAGKNSLTYRDIVNLILKTLGKRRIVVHIPIAISYLIAKLFSLFKIPFLQKSQVDNLKVDKEYIVDETEKIFRLKFTEPREGIYKIIR